MNDKKFTTVKVYTNHSEETLDGWVPTSVGHIVMGAAYFIDNTPVAIATGYDGVVDATPSGGDEFTALRKLKEKHGYPQPTHIENDETRAFDLELGTPDFTPYVQPPEEEFLQLAEFINQNAQLLWGFSPEEIAKELGPVIKGSGLSLFDLGLDIVEFNLMLNKVLIKMKRAEGDNFKKKEVIAHYSDGTTRRILVKDDGRL